MPELKKKKRVTELTIRIEREMHARPAKVVTLATDTFEALEKMTKSMAESRKFAKTQHDLEVVKQSLPNFVNVITNMRRARRDEKIERIAKHCHYLPVEPATPVSSSRLASPASARPSTAAAGSIGNLERRLETLKSFKQIDGLPYSHANAFDAFYFHDKPQTLSRRRGRLFRTPMPVSASPSSSAWQRRSRASLSNEDMRSALFRLSLSSNMSPRQSTNTLRNPNPSRKSSTADSQRRTAATEAQRGGPGQQQRVMETIVRCASREGGIRRKRMKGTISAYAQRFYSGRKTRIKVPIQPAEMYSA